MNSTFILESNFSFFTLYFTSGSIREIENAFRKSFHQPPLLPFHPSSWICKKKITAYTDVTADSARLKTNVSKVTKTQQIQPIRELLKPVLLSIMALRCCFKSLAGSIHHLIYSFHESILEKVDRKIEKIYPYKPNTVCLKVIPRKKGYEIILLLLLDIISSVFLLDRTGRQLKVILFNLSPV